MPEVLSDAVGNIVQKVHTQDIFDRHWHYTQGTSLQKIAEKFYVRHLIIPMDCPKCILCSKTWLFAVGYINMYGEDVSATAEQEAAVNELRTRKTYKSNNVTN